MFVVPIAIAALALGAMVFLSGCSIKDGKNNNNEGNNTESNNENEVTIDIPGDRETTSDAEIGEIEEEKKLVYISNEYLSEEEMKENAQYIYDSLLAEGWSKNAICAILGNMKTESTINPGLWQNMDEDNMNVGFGLVQWTPASRYFNWAEEERLEPYSIDAQLARIQLEVQGGGEPGTWQSFRHDAGMSFQEFTQSDKSPEELAEIFLYCYERPIDKPQPKRAEQAKEWYDYFN